MKLQLRLASLVAALGLLFSAAQSRAALVDDWGLTGQIYTNGSFGNWTDNASQSGQTTLTNASATIGSSTSSVSNYYTTEHWTEGNNTSPLGPGFPSGGKTYDQEFLSWRVVTVGGSDYLQVLLITSVDPSSGNAYGVGTYRNGDVFVNVNGDDYGLSAGSYADGLTTTNANQHPGTGLYSISGSSDVVDIVGQSQYGYGNNPVIANATNPFAVSSTATLTGDAVSVAIASVSGDSAPDWAVQWTVSLANTGSLYSSLYDTSTQALDFSNLVLHVTETCGNDVINTEASGSNEPNVPEPATLSLLGLGLATCGVIRRRVNKNKTR
jgi:hypothetical protein